MLAKIGNVWKRTLPSCPRPRSEEHTLRELREEHPAGTTLYWVIGSDNLARLTGSSRSK